MAESKLLDQVRAVLRARHYSLRTEESYVGWIGNSSHFSYEVVYLRP